MYDFDKVVDRRGTSSIKWNFQNSFGQQSGLLPYWIADTDFATVPEVVQALQKRCDHSVIGYSKPLPGVYTAIQGWWDRRHGWKPETDWMLLSYGVVTGIYFTLDTVVPKGEKVLTFTPVYDPFFAAIKNSGHTLVDCPLDHKDNYYTINWELLEKELADGVKAVVFCNPHNPIGRVWTEEEMEKLVELCVKYNVYLLSDEIHCDFGFTRPCTTAGKFPQIYDKSSSRRSRTLTTDAGCSAPPTWRSPPWKPLTPTATSGWTSSASTSRAALRSSASLWKKRCPRSRLPPTRARS